jgi:drug/metabolite transporter (DMT)-like permease
MMDLFMNQTNTNMQIEPNKSKAGMLWLIIGALFATLAAYYAFDHEARAGIRSGSLALVAYLVALIHILQAKKPSSTHQAWSGLTIHLIGASMLCVAFALTATTTLKNYRGLDIFDKLYLHKEGAIAMAWLFAFVFAAGAIVVKVFPQRFNLSVGLFLATCVSVLLIAFMAGPALIFEAIDSNLDVDQRIKYIKP